MPLFFEKPEDDFSSYSETGNEAIDSRLLRAWCATPSLCAGLFELPFSENSFSSSRLARNPFLRPALSGKVFDPFEDVEADKLEDAFDPRAEVGLFLLLPLLPLLPVSPNQLSMEGFSDLAAALES